MDSSSNESDQMFLGFVGVRSTKSVPEVPLIENRYGRVSALSTTDFQQLPHNMNSNIGIAKRRVIPAKEAMDVQVITRIRALFRQHDGCLWHTRGSRCELEQISNELRGTTSFVGRTVAQGHTARFWCSCKAASRASAVFSADDVSADAVVMRRWRAASRDCDANAVSAKPDPVTLEPCYIQHHYDLYNVEHARKPIRAARASVPLDRELAGAFVGKAGMRITALQTSLNGLRSVGVRPGCMRGGDQAYWWVQWLWTSGVCCKEDERREASTTTAL